MKKIVLHTILVLISYSTIKAQCLTKLDSGNYFNYGLKSDGTLWNWGSGAAFGQLGDGMEADHHVPTQLGTATNWQSFACGNYYVLAIKTNGTLWASGDNSTGQLGIGSSAIYSNTMIQVGTATNWKQVAPTSQFTIAVKTDGTLWGWGQNDESQMGDGSCCANRLSPGQIGTATNWKMAATAQTDTGMAIKTNGTLWGWGNNNSSGLLGPSTLSGVQTPTQIGTDTNWETMSIGASHILALKTDGSLWAWGGGGEGQTGDTLPPAYFRDTPVHIGTFTWLKVAAGFKSSYGIRSDGTLWAWGQNDIGQLGDGTITERRQPVQIGTDTDWAEIAAGYKLAVALKANGALWAWGSNDYGQLGNGGITATMVPTAIPVSGCTLGEPTFEQEPFTLYPNPAQNEISIRYQGQQVVTSLVIYDLTGRVVYKTTPVSGTTLQATLPVNMLQSGTYIVSLQVNGKKVVAKRFVKE